MSKIDLNHIIFDKKAIEEVNPQRYEMQQLDGIIWYDKEKFLILGYKDITEKEFWVRGHIPGRPLMPAVVMIEAAAQLSSVFIKRVYEKVGFIGFAGIEDSNFRKPVEPGSRLYLLGHIIGYERKKYTCKAQGIVNGTMVFDAVISGLRV